VYKIHTRVWRLFQFLIVFDKIWQILYDSMKG